MVVQYKFYGIERYKYVGCRIVRIIYNRNLTKATLVLTPRATDYFIWFQGAFQVQRPYKIRIFERWRFDISPPPPGTRDGFQVATARATKTSCFSGRK